MPGNDKHSNPSLKFRTLFKTSCKGCALEELNQTRHTLNPKASRTLFKTSCKGCALEEPNQTRHTLNPKASRYVCSFFWTPPLAAATLTLWFSASIGAVLERYPQVGRAKMVIYWGYIGIMENKMETTI